VTVCVRFVVNLRLKIENSNNSTNGHGWRGNVRGAGSHIHPTVE
jgi:hypothetical protein